MVSLRHLLTASVLALAIVLAGVVPSVAAGAGCSPREKLAGACPTVSGSIRDGGVTLEAETTTPGSNHHAGNSGTGNAAGSGTPAVTPPPTLAPPGTGAYYRSPLADRYPARADPAEAAPATPITLADLVNFRPVAGTNNMEPAGWGLIGLDTNFYATAASHIQNGTLLGLPASVRFTPVSYHWDYGDGTTGTRSTPGQAWRSSDDEFDRTPTSHIYTDAGEYTVTLTVNFAAAYRFVGPSWTPIAGTLPISTNPMTVTIGTATTVLVQHECTTNPDGPGC